jgi:hypothetical protein
MDDKHMNHHEQPWTNQHKAISKVIPVNRLSRIAHILDNQLTDDCACACDCQS